MKDRKKLIIAIVAAVVVLLLAFFAYSFFSDKNKLSRSEKKWIADNLNTIQNVNVINNANVFGDNGSGVFYDFIRDFQTEYRLEINPVTYLQGENPTGSSFKAGTSLTDNSTVFYEDHYVMVGKEPGIYSSSNDFNGKTIGLLQTDEEYIKYYLRNYEFKSYDSNEKLYEALKDDDVEFIIVPIIRDLDKILSNNYVINYHFSDIKYYFYFEGEKDDTLSSIIKKFFNNWKDKYFKEVFYDNEFNTFVDALGLTEADVSKLRSVTYNYGFINQNPYETITGGNFGGISAIYLKEFSDFSGVEFNFEKYKNTEKFNKAINNDKIDIYYNYYTFDNKLSEIGSYESIKASVIAPSNNPLTISSLYSLSNTDVYVQKNSKIADYLSKNSNLELNYYNNQKEMLKIAKKKKIIVIDDNIFNYYHKNKLKNYESRYNFVINDSYSFKVKDSKAFKTLMAAFIRTLDAERIKYTGIYNHEKTVAKGAVLAKIAHYFILILLFAVIFLLFFYKKSKKIIITKKIRNDDKIKYIDLLTSLKNRNYLSENMEIWNNNKIYPQTMIVIDLNNIAYLNDTKGYEAGDRQITALANILIKTQLDNSDVMRTNGNEFLIYLVGYQQKHIVNYIHKLTKEFKKLPYEYGAAIGYSMITDDIKTIEDAINEAIEDMKKQKPKNKEVKN
jgi:diguanylate cyclase (GGDEF)-like protein